MSRGFLVAFAAVLMCACAYEDPESNPAGAAHDENTATEVIGELGHPLNIRCVKPEKPLLFVFWNHGNKRNTWLHKNSVYGMTGNNLLIKSLDIETLGQYTCQAYSSEGLETPRVINVRANRPDGLISGDDWLVPRDAAMIPPDTTEALGESTTEKPEVAAAEGGIATLRCKFDVTKVHRDLSTKITWKFGEHEIDGTWGRYRVTSDGALQIVSLNRNDTGVYSCVPDNALGDASHEIHLLVNDPVTLPAGIAGEHNATITVELDQPLHVRCLAYGYPNPSVFWTRDDGVGIVLYNNSIYEVTESVLVIRNLSVDALGPYTCRAYNEAGKMASWGVSVRAYRPEGLLIENKWLVPRDTMSPTPIPITQPSITTNIWPFTDKVYNCDKYLVNCSRLRCEYGIQRTRQHDGCEQCSCVQVEIDCEPLKQECTQLKCNYGTERVTGTDGCERCICSEDPCIRANCQPPERCEAVAIRNPISQEPEYSAKCVYENTEVHQCDEYLANCSRLRCEYGIQRTRQHDGCKQCSCVQGESDCEPLQQECTHLQCSYGIERLTGPDGCERCKCKEYPCEKKSCAAGERCAVQQYFLVGFHSEPQFTTECRLIVKAGACPMDETTTGEDTCHRECVDDAHCRGEAKCCRRGCSDVCLASVEQTSPRPLFTTTRASNPDQLLPPDCTPYQQECEALDCQYGDDRFTQDGCLRCVCSEDPCIRAYCQPPERCEAVAIRNPISQEPEYSAKCVYENNVVDQCDEYVANCSRLRCEYGIQRTRQHDGCEQCSCVQGESDCEPLQQECTHLQCSYGIKRLTGPDGCERCKCKEYPCEKKSCAAGERCAVQQYFLVGFHSEPQFTTECRLIVKAGACPMDETTTGEDTCHRECVDDAHCRGEAKCCRRGCSDVCLAPVEQTSPRPLLTTTIASNPDQLLPPDCTPYQQECEALDCQYGDDRFTQDGCLRCVCREDPCTRANCQPPERCEAVAIRNPISQEPEYSAKCVYENNKVHHCDEYVANCSRLRCEYGIQRTRQHDGCERCKCKENPCERKSCAAGERCVVHQYVLLGFQPERRFTAECRTIVKAGACPMDETTTDEVMCHPTCADDADCRGVAKCCRRGCSDVCLTPVEQTNPRPLLTTTLASNPVKKSVGIHGDQNAAEIGELGQPLPVHCLAYGNPPPAVFWYFGYEENMVPYNNVDYLAREFVLLFRNLTIKNLGRYTCHAYNGEDKVATWSVIVQAYMPEGLFIDNEFVVPRTQLFTAAETTTKTLSTKKPFTLLLILPVTAHVSTPFSILNIGADLNLTCEIEGSPVPEVNWTKDGDNIPLDPRITVSGGTGVSRLTVTRVTVADSGLYACHASNPYSSQSDTAQVNVQKLITPAECIDDEPISFCALIVHSKFCRNKNYSKSCCKSCVEAGQLDASDLYQGFT